MRHRPGANRPRSRPTEARGRRLPWPGTQRGNQTRWSGRCGAHSYSDRSALRKRQPAGGTSYRWRTGAHRFWMQQSRHSVLGRVAPRLEEYAPTCMPNRWQAPCESSQEAPRSTSSHAIKHRKSVAASAPKIGGRQLSSNWRAHVDDGSSRALKPVRDICTSILPRGTVLAGIDSQLSEIQPLPRYPTATKQKGSHGQPSTFAAPNAIHPPRTRNWTCDHSRWMRVRAS